MSIFQSDQRIEKVKSIFSTEQVNKIFIDRGAEHPSSRKVSKTESPYGNRLRESRKLSLFYGNLSKKYLQKVFQKGCSSPSRITESAFSILESRLDVVLYRAGFFESVAAAKQMIRVGGIEVNLKKTISPGYSVIQGDLISVSEKKNKKRILYSPSSFFRKASSLPPLLGGKQEKGKDKKLVARKKEVGWRFGLPVKLLYLLKFKKANSFITFLSKRLKLQLFYSKSTNLITKWAKKYRLSAVNTLRGRGNKDKRTESFFLKEKAFQKVGIQDKENDRGISFSSQSSKKAFSRSSAFSRYRKSIQVKDLNRRSSLFFLKKEGGIEKIRKMDFKREKENTFFSLLFFSQKRGWSNEKQDLSNNFRFLNYLFNLKKQVIVLHRKTNCFLTQKNSPFFKDQPFFFSKKAKALHLEVSYRSLSIVFLFPPQRICFPYFINLPLIYK